MYFYLRFSIETERVKRYYFGLGGSNEHSNHILPGPPQDTYLRESSG